jgi:glycosyltransferase involved in cell wall biosynthesis
MMGRALAERGHEVVWWTANFDHYSKQFRAKGSTEIVVCPGFTIRLVQTPAYRRHVGFARLWFEAVFAYRLQRIASKLPAPQIIVSADVTMAVAYAAASLAKRFHANLVFDICDLYPEVFVGILPRRLRSNGNTILSPLYASRSYFIQKADAVIAVCDDYLIPAQRATTLSKDRMLTVYCGVDLGTFRASQGSREESRALADLLCKGENDVYAIYAGTLGLLYDIDALLKAAVLLQASGSFVKILIAGGGPRADDIRSFIRRNGLLNVQMLGEIGFAELIRIYQICDIGLSIYGVDSPVAMPIKVFDYFAAGLPIVNSVRGFLERFLQEHHIGAQYAAGDPESLARALSQMTSDRAARQEMARNAFDAAVQFDSRVQYGRFAEMLEALQGADAASTGPSPDKMGPVLERRM